MSKKCIVDLFNDALMDLLSRIEEGDEKSLKELQDLANYIKGLSSLIDTVIEIDSTEELLNRLDELGNSYESILLDVFKAVG